MAWYRRDTVLWSVFLLLLILAPLPSGSISSLAQASVVFGLLTLSTISYVRQGWRPGRWSPSVERRFRIIMLCWMFAVALACFQIMPLPPALIATLSPSLFNLYSWTVPGEHQQHAWRALSTAPAATLQSGLLIAACSAAFLLVVRHGHTRRRMVMLAVTVVLIGAGQAVYGLAQSAETGGTPASGTFVNRNHFSALLLMALSICLGLVLWRWEASRDPFGRPAESEGKVDHWARTSPLLVVSLMTLAAVIFSFSRTGLIISLALVALFGISASLGNPGRLVGFALAATVAGIILLLSGAWRGFQVIASRFETIDTSYRLAAWQGTVDLFHSSPWVGVGLGGLVDNISRFLPLSIPETFDHTHNEPLEILAEGGVIYAGLLTPGLFVYFGTLMPAWLARRAPLARGLGWGCLMGACAVFLFSLVEFPLRMPANAVILSAILGLGWAVVHDRNESPRRENRVPEGQEPAHSSGLIMPRIGLLMAVMGMCVSAVTAAGALLDRVGDGLVAQADVSPDDRQHTGLDQAVKLYRYAQQIEPWQPAHAFKLGRAYELMASALPPISEQTKTTWADAAASYEQAVRLHPANARMQTALAWAALQSGDLIEARRAAQAAVKLNPADPNVRFAVGKWYLVQWETLTPEEQQMAAALVRRSATDLPVAYLDALWSFVPDVTTIKSLLPDDLEVRRLWLDTLTKRQLFSERWAEQEVYPALRLLSPDGRLRIVSAGELTGRQSRSLEADPAEAWTGMVQGWLSSGLTATSKVALPHGEAVLLIPMRAEAAGGVWPTVGMTLDGTSIPPLTLSDTGWRTVYVHVTTEGGTFLLRAVLTNGAVIHEQGRFAERRAALGAIRIATPQSQRHHSRPPSMAQRSVP